LSIINLSYIIATRNRLAFLKITLEKLISELQHDEEIIVIDGDSNDGSKQYLQHLFETQKIHQFKSEPDHNQADAWNKGMLMAKGIIIKKIIDDDVHDFTAIRRCKNFMLSNFEVDVCISNSLESNLNKPAEINFESRFPWYKKWRKGQIKTFSFGDVHMLIRKSSLSYIGLYDTQFKMIDWEYSLRISFLGAKIAYYTGCNSMSVSTPGNVSSSANKKLFKDEEAIGKLKYGYPGDGSETGLYSHIKIAIGTLIHRYKAAGIPESIIPAEIELKKLYAVYYEKLEEHNKSGNNWEFIY
jgi:glycosyltransferase involved in cell wall biosynthesis